MNAMNVRLAIPDEAAVVSQILQDDFADYESLYTPLAFAATTPSAQQIIDRWNEGPVWVAIRDCDLLGTIAAVPTGENVCIRSMAIRPRGQGFGLGRLLLEQVERFANENGFRQMRLSTTPFLLRAIRLYEQFGFTRTDDGPFDLFGTPLFTMMKNI